APRSPPRHASPRSRTPRRPRRPLTSRQGGRASTRRRPSPSTPRRRQGISRHRRRTPPQPSPPPPPPKPGGEGGNAELKCKVEPRHDAHLYTPHSALRTPHLDHSAFRVSRFASLPRSRIVPAIHHSRRSP